ncbi:MAG TPA: hypothetical protein VK712_04245 [Verrucomicrobiae bacterium]|jgi:hypothetical protein|nr:hypothetical protein [Verrucomicrobiae bacterium]
MSSKRLYFALVGVITLLFVALVGGAYGANSLLSTQATKLTALKAKSQAQSQEQVSLIEAKKDIQKYASLAQITSSVVPEDKDQAETVREIVNIAAANNVSLSAITFPASTLGTSSSAATGATTAAPAPTAATNLNSSTTKLSQLLPVTNIPGVYDLQITVQGDPNKPVQYSSFINFLSSLEHNRRTAEISTITIAPSSTNANLLTFALTLNEYIKP